MASMTYHQVLSFWFEEIPTSAHFKKDPEFDRLLTERFSSTYHRAAQGECFEWRENAEGRLAEIIVLDQFPRNMFREDPRSFATDPLALVLAQEAVMRKIPDELPLSQRSFFYMPYMHSESKIVHGEAVKLFSEPGFEGSLKFELKHKAM